MSKKMRILSKVILILVAVVLVCAGCGRTKYYGGGYSQGNGTGTGSGKDSFQDMGQAGAEADEEEPQTAEELFVETLELSVVGDVEANPSGRLTNAIIDATKIVIIEDKGDSCKIQITYPNVKDAFLEATADLTEDLNEETVNAFYGTLEKKLSNGELPMLEVTLELAVETTDGGQKAIQWTTEAQNALTGGLYDIYYNGMNEKE